MDLKQKLHENGLPIAVSVFLSALGLLGTGVLAIGVPLLVVSFAIFFWSLNPAAKARQRRSSTPEEARSEGAVSTSTDHGGLHRLIDEAAAYLEQEQPAVAIEQLERIRQRHWDESSPRERYRVLANIGTGWLAQQEQHKAAQFFIQAAEHQPEDEQARAFRALAHYLLGERETAYALAVELCGDHPSLGRAHMIRIRAAPESVLFEELLGSVPNAVRGDSEVALSIHDRAVAEGRLDEAEQILKARHEKSREWGQSNLRLGTTILDQVVKATRLTVEGPVMVNRLRLEEAVELFTRALKQLPEADPEGLSSAYLNRGISRRLLGEVALAREDFRKAYDLAPSDEAAAIQLARLAYPDNEDMEGAISILTGFLRENDSSEVELLLASYLEQRGRPEDLERVLGFLLPQMQHLGELEPEDRRADALMILADAYIKTDRGEMAVSVFGDLPDGILGPVMGQVLLGEVLWRLGREEKALAEALSAKQALGDSSDWSPVSRAALLLERLNQYGDAFNLWKRVLSPNFVTAETDHLLRCARKSEEYQFVLEFCQQLRSGGHYDGRALGHEIEILLDYSEYQRAREAFLDYLEAKPEDKRIALQLTTLAIRQGWKDLVEKYLPKLPSVDEVEAVGLGRQVVDVLRFGPKPEEAVDYAYALYRRFPDEAAAHQALIVAVLAPGEAGLSIQEPTKVGHGAAVCYSESGAEQTRWLIVEDGDGASLARSEYHSSHPLVRTMWGKEVGSEFALSEKSLRDRSGVIRKILDKRVFRANEMMQEWMEHFPDQPFIEPVPVRISDSPSQEDFAEVIKVMKKSSEQRETLESLFADGNSPISTFALVNRRDVFETMGYLAANPDLRVRACNGSAQELEAAVGFLDKVGSVVLDPSAVATLALLEETSVLGALPFRCLVTEGTLQELRKQTGVDSLSSRASGYMGYRAGRLLLQEVEPEQEVARLERLSDLLAYLEEVCEVIGGSDLAGIDPVARRQVVESGKQSSAEAIAAASRREALLWTDDLLFHACHQKVLPAQRVWTQAVLTWANTKGLVERARSSRLTARLLRFGYVFTSLSPVVILDTCESTSWNTLDADLAAVLADFGNDAWDYESALRMTVVTVTRVWREAPTEEHARVVTGRLLAHLAGRTDHERIVRQLLQNLGVILGLALTRTEPLRQVLEASLHGRAALI